MFDLENILDFIDNNNDNLSSLFKDIKGYTTKEIEKRNMKRLLKIKRVYLLGKQFQEKQQKGKRKGYRFFYFKEIKRAWKKKEIEYLKAILTYARVHYKLSASRTSRWRLKKELQEIGIPNKYLILLEKTENEVKKRNT